MVCFKAKGKKHKPCRLAKINGKLLSIVREWSVNVEVIDSFGIMDGFYSIDDNYPPDRYYNKWHIALFITPHPPKKILVNDIEVELWESNESFVLSGKARYKGPDVDLAEDWYRFEGIGKLTMEPRASGVKK